MSEDEEGGTELPPRLFRSGGRERMTEYPRPFWTWPRLLVLFALVAGMSYWLIR